MCRPKTFADAVAYVEAVSMTNDFQYCEHGHCHCALVDGGPCANEVDVQFGVSDSQIDNETEPGCTD